MLTATSSASRNATNEPGQNAVTARTGDAPPLAPDRAANQSGDAFTVPSGTPVARSTVTMPRASAATTEPPSSPAANPNPTTPDMNRHNLELKRRLTRIAQDPAEMNKYLSDVTTRLRAHLERNKVSELLSDEMKDVFDKALEYRLGELIPQDDTIGSKSMWLQKNLLDAAPKYPGPSNAAVNGQSDVDSANPDGNNTQQSQSQLTADAANGEPSQDHPVEFVGGNFTMLTHEPGSREAKNTMANILSDGTMYTINTETGSNQAFVATNKVIIQEGSNAKIIVSSIESPEHNLDEPVRPKAVAEAIKAGKTVVHYPDYDGGVWKIEDSGDITYIDTEGTLIDNVSGSSRVVNSLEYTATNKPFYRQGEKPAAIEGQEENQAQAETIASRRRMRVKEQFVFDTSVMERLEPAGRRHNLKSGDLLAILARTEPHERGLLIDYITTNDELAAELRKAFNVPYDMREAKILAIATGQSLTDVARQLCDPIANSKLRELLNDDRIANYRPELLDEAKVYSAILYSVELLENGKASLGLKSAALQDIKALANSVAALPFKTKAEMDYFRANNKLQYSTDVLNALDSAGNRDRDAVMDIMVPYFGFIGDNQYHQILNSSDPYQAAKEFFTGEKLKGETERSIAIGDIGINNEMYTIKEVQTENAALDALRSFLIRKAPAVAAEAMFIHALGLAEGAKTLYDIAGYTKGFIDEFNRLGDDIPFEERMFRAAAKVGLDIVVDKTGAKIVEMKGWENSAAGKVAEALPGAVINEYY